MSDEEAKDVDAAVSDDDAGTAIPNEGENFEAKAAKMGWVPQDEWHGDPKAWRPAKEFVERGENIIPILNSRLEKLEAELQMAAKLNKKELEEMKVQSYERAKSEYEQKLSDLREKENQAFLEGDQEAWDKIREQRDKIKPPEEVKVEQEAPESPDFAPWVEKNPWFKEDEELRLYAENVYAGIVNAMNQQGKILPDKDLYKKVEVAVKGAYPEKFTNPRREEPSSVEGGSESSPKKSGGKSFNDLPADAKATYKRLADKFKMQGRELTKDQYATSYFED